MTLLAVIASAWSSGRHSAVACRRVGFSIGRLHRATGAQAVALAFVAQTLDDSASAGPPLAFCETVGLEGDLRMACRPWMSAIETACLDTLAGCPDHAHRYGQLCQAMARQPTVANVWRRAAPDRIEAARRARVRLSPIEWNGATCGRWR
jgi:hypothetical protein